MDGFRARTQYNDLVGTTAADESDTRRLKQQLIDQNQMTDEEVILGVKIYLSGQKPYVRVLAYEPRTKNLEEELAAHDGKIPVRVVRPDFTLEEILKFYKRLDISLHPKSLDLDDAEIEEVGTSLT